MVGFLPRRSIVLIPFGRGRSLGGMRVDLPPGDLATAPLAATFIGMVCRVSAVDAVALSSVQPGDAVIITVFVSVASASVPLAGVPVAVAVLTTWPASTSAWVTV